MVRKSTSIILGLLALTTASSLALLMPIASSVASAKTINIAVTSSPIDRFYLTSTSTKAGKLEFIGGLQIDSESKYFGGFSGLAIKQNGQKLITVSDTANWLTANLQRDENGKLTGIKNTNINCLCRKNGKSYGGKYMGDAESLVISGKLAHVSFEGVNRINTYDLDESLIPSNARQATPTFKPYKLSGRKGLEALALAPKSSPIAGKFLAIAEQSLNAKGNHRAFIAGKEKIEELSITATDDFEVTDAEFLENGDLLILERRLGLIIDLGVRIRRFKADTIAPATLLFGEVIFESGITSQIDNMEGLAAWKNSNGETILTLISDDNFIGIQRTILIEFKLLN